MTGIWLVVVMANQLVISILRILQSFVTTLRPRLDSHLGFQIVLPNALSIVVNEGESKRCVLKVGLAQMW